MTTRQFIFLWETAQPVPRGYIEHMGKGIRQLAHKELYSGVYGEIWIGPKGRYYYSEGRNEPSDA